MREKLLIMLKWISATLTISPMIMLFYVFFLEIFNAVDSNVFLLERYANNFWLIVPIGLSYISIDRTKKSLHYLLSALLIIGLSYLLSFSIPIVVVTVLICFIRFVGRINGSDIWIDDMKMEPIFIMAVLYVVGIGLSNDTFRSIIFLNAMVYLLLGFLIGYLTDLNEFVRQNRDSKNFPLSRIEQTYKVVLSIFFIIIVLFGIPIYLFKEFLLAAEVSLFAMLSNPFKIARLQKPIEREIIKPSAVDVDFSELRLEQGEPSVILTLLGNLLILIIGIGVVALVIYAIYRMNLKYRTNYSQGTDIIEDIEPAKEEGREIIAKVRGVKNKKASLTVNHKIRNIYKKIILRKHKDLPKRHNTPKELERAAMLEDTDKTHILHQYYEKARYSKEGCKDKDYDELKGYFDS